MAGLLCLYQTSTPKRTKIAWTNTQLSHDHHLHILLLSLTAAISSPFAALFASLGWRHRITPFLIYGTNNMITLPMGTDTQYPMGRWGKTKKYMATFPVREFLALRLLKKTSNHKTSTLDEQANKYYTHSLTDTETENKDTQTYTPAAMNCCACHLC